MPYGIKLYKQRESHNIVQYKNTFKIERYENTHSKKVTFKLNTFANSKP